MLFILEKLMFYRFIERANIANRANATIFVSIHCNANKKYCRWNQTYVMGMTKIASI
jgi:N-acetylmuramoyl-L-alanine amidase